jgi:hypothetical protein
MIGMAVVLALVAFAIFGPLANLFLWAFAEKWYFPYKIPQEFGLKFWGQVFSPRGNALASLGTSVWIAVLTVALSLAVAIPESDALGRQAPLAQSYPARVSAAAGGSEPAGVREHRARVLRDRPQRDGPRRRAGARVARARARRLDRIRRIRVRRAFAGGSRAQHGSLALDVLPDSDAAARGTGPHRERDFRVPRIA